MLTLLITLGCVGVTEPALDDTAIEGDADTDADTDTDADADADLARGEEVYTGTCAGGYCHGSDTIHEERVPEMSDEEIWDTIENGSGYMSAQDLPDDDIANVIVYMRTVY